MNVRDYSAAILALHTKEKEETLLLKLKDVLQKHGHERLYPKILADLKEKLERQEKSKSVTITLARTSDEKLLMSEIEKALTELGATDYTTTIDPTITGGFIAQGGEKRIDASYKKSLLALYRALIA